MTLQFTLHEIHYSIGQLVPINSNYVTLVLKNVTCSCCHLVIQIALICQENTTFHERLTST